jgi:hypothetical protein
VSKNACTCPTSRSTVITGHAKACPWFVHSANKPAEDKPAEVINHPPHYTKGGIEAIEVIEAWELGFCLGNVLKYIARAGRKGAKIECLRKARWYLDREISRMEREGGRGGGV